MPVFAEGETSTHVLLNTKGEIVYGSRHALPTIGRDRSYTCGPFGIHGIYVYNRMALNTFYGTDWEAPTPLEELENLEFMRFIDLGIPVNTMRWNSSFCDEVNFPEDVERVESLMEGDYV